VKEPFILLVHQGMIEDVLIEDLRERGVEVTRSSPFVKYSLNSDLKAPIDVFCQDANIGAERTLRSKYLVGCDGARSMVRASIPDAQMIGDSTRAPWGVLDGMLLTSTHLSLINRL
jgi:phenol 2-monooxygenase